MKVETQVSRDALLVSFKTRRARVLEFVPSEFPPISAEAGEGNRLAFAADGHSGVHQGTGRLGKWPDSFEMDITAVKCITSVIDIAASSELSNSSVERSEEQNSVKSCQSALSKRQRGR